MTPGIVVIGGAPFFSRQTCGLVESEFEMGCLRLDRVEQASGQADEFQALNLLIVDESLADDLLARPEIYHGLNPTAQVALAYRHVDLARDFYRNCAPETHGRIGFLPMAVPFEVWLSSLRLLLHKESFLPSDLLYDTGAVPQPAPVVALPSRDQHGAQDGRLGLLTARETEVLRLVAGGESNKVIARQLDITEHTVKLHMHNLSRKLGVSNRTAAASFYLAAQPGDAPGNS